MRISTTWLQSLLRRTISERELAEALERAGIEVEQLIVTKPIDLKIIVGRVKKCVQHPNADRLNVATVEIPGHELEIVCGAPNVRAGLTVAVAQIGATLPGGEVISAVKLRGVASQGMLCSGRELGINDDHDGLLELSDDLPLGMSVAKIYPADGTLEIKTAANRPDLQSVIGLAREAGAQLQEPVMVKNVPLPKLSKTPAIKIESKLVKRLIVAELELGKVEAAGLQQLQSRLRTSNVRSIAPVVDITNAVMLYTGQPLHAYDADKVQGTIHARQAKEGEKLVTLDGRERTLSAADLVIADDSGAIGLAGVMGGAATEVSASTTRIYLEAAVFDPATIRKSALAHRLRSEASGRFERGLPLEFAALGLMHGVKLLEEYVGAKLVSVSVAGEELTPPVTVALHAAQLSRLLGTVIDLKAAAKLLPRLGYEVALDKDKLEAIVPYWRPDVRLPEDLIEDIVRLAGYETIPSTMPAWRPKRIIFDRNRGRLRRINELLVGSGLTEVHTYSFVSREQIEALGDAVDDYLALANPMSQEQAYLRRSPLPNLLSAIQRNQEGRRAIGLYEITGVFVPNKAGELPQEPLRLAVICYGRSGSYRRLKGVFDQLERLFQVELLLERSTDGRYASGRVASVKLGKTTVGMIGQLSPATVRAFRIEGEVSYLELDLAPLLASSKPVAYHAPSKYPAARRDLAVVVAESVDWQELAKAVGKLGLAELAFLSDYRGDDLPTGTKSLAMRLTMSAEDHTLTDAEADERLRQIIRTLERDFKATVR